MSRSIQDYWREIRAVERSLPEFVWLVGQAREALPFLTQVPAGIAARLLQAKTHRVATPDEIAAHLEQEQAAVKSAKRDQLRRTGADVVVVEAPEPTPEPAPKRRR
ncbi:MAG: hypothetical protein RL328_2746 [Acidobacteriota bacterium]|jgi:hypothetical protein